jgi:hypothetical protein
MNTTCTKVLVIAAPLCVGLACAVIMATMVDLEHPRNRARIHRIKKNTKRLYEGKWRKQGKDLLSEVAN